MHAHITNMLILQIVFPNAQYDTLCAAAKSVQFSGMVVIQLINDGVENCNFPCTHRFDNMHNLVNVVAAALETFECLVTC